MFVQSPFEQAMNIFRLILLAFSIAASSADATELPNDLVNKMRTTVRELCPDAQIEVSDREFTAKHGTMMFTLHNTSKTGEIHPKTYQTEGPSFRGFILTVSLQKGPYRGAAVVPLTDQGPYFPPSLTR
jgi:hypothetical protein